MNLSYHAWKDYVECPKRYFLKHRKRAAPTTEKNDYWRLYGLTVERFFTMFCNIWRFKQSFMWPDTIREKLSAIYQDTLETLDVQWDGQFVSQTKEEVFEEAFTHVCAIMDSPSQNYFLNSKSEISLELMTKDGVNVTGRIDVIHENPLSKGISIIDGKGSTKVGKNVDKNQLLFYALLYFFHYKVLPEELGFFYYRFNTFTPVPVSLAILNEFRAKLSLDIRALLKESEFKACPKAKWCKRCDYHTGCTEAADREAKARKGSKLNITSTGDITEFGF